MSGSEIAITGVGMTTAIGLGAEPTAAAARAGISRFEECEFRDQHLEPFVVASVPDELLFPAPAEPEDSSSLSPRERRMLRLAAPALREAMARSPGNTPPPLYLALPETLPGHESSIGPEFLAHLAAQSEDALDTERSRVFPNGRAGGLLALAQALADLSRAPEPSIVVGGVDSFLDEALLTALDREGRVLAEGVGDGFIPGEGAGFVLVARPDATRNSLAPPLARIDAVAAGREPGHRYATEPYRGEGLAETVRECLSSASIPDLPIRSVMAGFNGEFLGTKEWGVTLIRNSDSFAADLEMIHPADCFGDTGAAHGVLLLGLACFGLSRGHTAGPCLVWASSDLEQRGAAVLGEPTS
jgi:3-oxoacyl-[acyl-carrier-protein] synthase-1